MNDKNLIEFFPKLYPPREEQTRVLNELEKHIRNGVKFIILEAPTGFGKSAIASTLANFSDSCTPKYEDYIRSNRAFEKDSSGCPTNIEPYDPFGGWFLTVTKSLQDQYEDTFDDVYTFKGLTNYRCDIDDMFDVEAAPCIISKPLLNDCLKRKRCPYYNARNEAYVNKFSVVNYKKFFALENHLKDRQFIVCDEASELETELVNQFTLEVDHKLLDFLGVIYNPLRSDDAYASRVWLERILEQVSEMRQQFLKDVDFKKHTKSSEISLKKLKLVTRLKGNIEDILEFWDLSEYITENLDGKSVFKPFNIIPITQCIFEYSKTIILMSATFIDIPQYAKDLGISNYEVIRAKSSFDPKKSPIYCSNNFPLNKDNLNDYLPDIVKTINQICEHHKNDKGVIHTHTNVITTYLRDNIKSDRFLYRIGATKNEEILENHKNTKKPTVLVSPSLTHGVDLKDDLSRFQIIVKLPFPSLGDKRTKKMFDKNKVWYQNRMISSLVQTCGRSTRNDNDHSITYILDSNVISIIKRGKEKLPQHFIDRIM